MKEIVILRGPSGVLSN